MIKLVYCFCRKPGMTMAEFSDYWTNVHGPLAAKIPGLRRLVQTHALDGATDSPPALGRGISAEGDNAPGRSGSEGASHAGPDVDPGVGRSGSESPSESGHFDGMAELWFDNEAALERARQSPAWKAINDDEANFIEPGSGVGFTGRECLIVPADGNRRPYR